MAHKLIHKLMQNGVSRVDVLASVPLPVAMSTEQSHALFSVSVNSTSEGAPVGVALPKGCAIQDTMIASLWHFASILDLELHAHLIHGPLLRTSGLKHVAISASDSVVLQKQQAAFSELTGVDVDSGTANGSRLNARQTFLRQLEARGDDSGAMLGFGDPVLDSHAMYM